MKGGITHRDNALSTDKGESFIGES